MNIKHRTFLAVFGCIASFVAGFAAGWVAAPFIIVIGLIVTFLAAAYG